MKTPPGAPEWLKAYTAAERPDLWRRAHAERTFDGVWPEYNHHGNHAHRYFGALFPAYSRFQVLFVDRRSDQLAARARTIPFRWDGTLDDLPRGIDAVGLGALDGAGPPTALSALAAEVNPGYRSIGLSSLVIEAMAMVARSAGLAPLVAPVRPRWKERYPLIPIERYALWQREDGLPFDPWMRVHARLGGGVLRPEPRSMQITGPVADWEAWTGMRLPDDGAFVFPGGLAPLIVAGGVGHYWEPNVWVVHRVH
jgi:hypothetical protein